jgi:hydrogenase maturation protease
VHELGLHDLLDAARLTGALPVRRALVGVQPERLGWGMTLSPPVEAALPAAVESAASLLERWLAAGRC